MRVRLPYFGIALAALLGFALPVSAQSAPQLSGHMDEGVPVTPLVTHDAQQIESRISTSVSPSPQDYCITMMAEFPNDNHIPRYQFFRLTEELSRDVTASFQHMLSVYGDKDIPANTPILEIIEAIANPVLRQAAPEIVATYMGQLIQFSQSCEPFISGQVKSLQAYDFTLEQSDKVIREDALYLRQILLDSLARLGADQDPNYAYSVANYQSALVRTRDDIEYTAFVLEIDDIEALYMDDLDGRLARSNDMINEEINRETLGDAVTLSDDMNKDLKRKGDEQAINTLLRILTGY